MGLAYLAMAKTTLLYKYRSASKHENHYCKLSLLEIIWLYSTASAMCSTSVVILIHSDILNYFAALGPCVCLPDPVGYELGSKQVQSSPSKHLTYWLN